MHSFLVALAYMAMVFAPCAVAQWGDVLNMESAFGMIFGRRRASSRMLIADPMHAALRQQRRRAAALAAAEMEPLIEAAFVAPPRLIITSSRRKFATPTQLNAFAATAARESAFEQGVARVAARLAELSEMHRRANQPEVALPTPVAASAPAQPMRIASSPKKPVVQSHVFDPSLVAAPAALPAAVQPAAAMREALRVPAERKSPLSVVPLSHEDDALLHRLTLLIAGSALPQRATTEAAAAHDVALAESPPRSVAA